MISVGLNVGQTDILFFIRDKKGDSSRQTCNRCSYKNPKKNKQKVAEMPFEEFRLNVLFTFYDELVFQS